MSSLTQFDSPQLAKIHQGKVRESFKIDEKIRLIVTTDRLSCFDKILKSGIPGKGIILNEISYDWFNKTQHIINNHVVKKIHPRMLLVKQAKPIGVEMIVRQYLSGSLWRKYQSGQRVFWGVKLQDKMHQNEKLPSPIITPTTKGIVDEDISSEKIVEKGLATSDIYKKMYNISLELFSFGQEQCKKNGLILVDTKYEFGLINNELYLIDEIHTPDSSRFWLIEDYQNNNENIDPYDKEYVRQWILQNNASSKIPSDVIEESFRRYNIIYERLTSQILSNEGLNFQSLTNSLLENKLITCGYVVIFMGSNNDLAHALKIKSELDKYPIMVKMHIVSAHKNGEDILQKAKEYNQSIEPGVAIAIAGRSNGLGGALAANLNIPLINCPPFKDYSDLQVNIYSSLIMPSQTPATFCLEPKNTANAAVRALNIPNLRLTISNEIENMKNNIRRADINLNKQAVMEQI
ncbi:MAG: AIR carboxylase family protein [Legionellales bacterium]|nr:AIR carboxylase family protein [Legionellales bacterium]